LNKKTILTILLATPLFITILTIENFQPTFAQPACLSSPQTLEVLLADPENCIQVDDKTFINFREYIGDLIPSSIDVTGVTVGNEKGLQFNFVGFSVFFSNPTKNIVFDYDVISSGDLISDNTLTLDSSPISDLGESPLTRIVIEERVFDILQNQIAFKVVFADGIGAQDLLDHVDYPSLHQMVTVNVNIELLLEPSSECFVQQAICLVTLGQFTQTFSQEPAPSAIGGELIPIDTTALLLASVQSISMWMIPVVVAGIAIGVFVIKRRK